MAEKPLKKDLKQVIKEISKAPGGNVAMPRPVTPGGIQGGPPTIASPVPGGIQRQPEGPLVKRDIAREAFRGFKTGEQVTSNIPEPIDTETLEVKKVKPTGKKGFKGTQEQKNVAQGVRGGTIGGMTRAPGSKPSLAKTLPMAIEIATARAARRAEIDTIQESLRDALLVERGGKTTTYVSDPTSPKAGVISREEQKMIDRAAQAARDALLDRDAAIRESVMMRDVNTGEVNPLAERTMQSEADRRVTEGLKAIGKGTVAFGALGLVVDAVSLWRQLIQEAEITNQQIQSNLMN